VFYAFLTLMACIDLLSFLLPRLYTVTFIFSGLLYQTWNNNILSGLFCAMLMFFIMLFVRLYFAYKNGTESFGMGDVLLIAGT
ncbi:prepilin peptidase, partial [Escherichia coli]